MKNRCLPDAAINGAQERSRVDLIAATIKSHGGRLDEREYAGDDEAAAELPRGHLCRKISLNGALTEI